MRRNLSKLPCPVIGRTTSSIYGCFSTSSTGGDGRGRGRGRGSIPSQFSADAPSKIGSNNSKHEDASPPPPPPPPPPLGHGRGRGTPLSSPHVLPSFSSFLNNASTAPRGRGRGFVPPKSVSPPPPPQDESQSTSALPQKPDVKPLPLLKDNEEKSESFKFEASGEIINVLQGAGRGKPANLKAVESESPKLENRHIRRREQPVDKSPREQLSQEDKVKKAVEILSKGNQNYGRDTEAVDSGGRGRGRGRWRGRGRGRGRGRFDGRGRGRFDEESDEEPSMLCLGDAADEEKVAKKLGPEIMSQLAEGLEEMSNRVLPSAVDDAYLDALHTNLLIECEPEYLMEEFGTNPDIDEKPPIPLRDALEKMKPFLMSYEGIQSQEEWEEVMEETMQTVPLIKEIVDHYSGPDRVTAKQQQQELERVAKTLPANAPDSVKRFTDRALLSLLSNAGWGFDKKCQFMDKLVMEVSNQYK